MKKHIRFISVIVVAVTLFTSLFGILNAGPMTTYAAGGEVESYSSLAASKDDFVYVATEFLEYAADGSLTATDYRVEPGQMLQMRVYIKTDRYLCTGNLGFGFDNTFFDVKNGAAEHLSGIEHTVPLANGSLGVNYSNSAMSTAGTIFTKNTKEAAELPVIKNELLSVPNKTVVFNEGTADESSQTIKLSETAVEYFVFLKEGMLGVGVWPCAEDEWCFATDITVKSGLSDGETGWTMLDERYYSVYNVTEPLSKGTRPFDIKSDASPDMTAAACKGLVYRSGSEYIVNVSPDNFITDDCNHVFVIGDSAEIPDNTDDYVPPVTEEPTEPETEPVVPPVTEDGDVEFKIKTPSVSEIKYGDSVYLYAKVPEEYSGVAKVQWYCNNTCFSPNMTSGNPVLFASQDNGTATITSVLLDEDGDVLASDAITLTSKANIFYKIIGFFKQLFGLTEVYDAPVQ